MMLNYDSDFAHITPRQCKLSLFVVATVSHAVLEIGGLIAEMSLAVTLNMTCSIFDWSPACPLLSFCLP